MLSETISNKADSKEPTQVAEGIVMYPEIMEKEYLDKVTENGYVVNLMGRSFILHISV